MKINRRSLVAGALAGAAACATRRDEALARGLWRGDDSAFAIGRFPEFGQADFAFDYAALRVGPLAKGVDGLRRMGAALDGAGASIAEITRFGASLRVNDRTLRPAGLRRVPFNVESHGVSLSAEIAVPDERRGSGAILMIYGSGPAPKEALDLWAFWFLVSGYAVITYDKRGSGNSTGDWRLASLESLAADARAVIASARNRYPRDTRPLICWGASQAGWILPQLGAAGAIDAIIMHAGSAMTPADQIVAAIEAELRAYGFDEDEIGRARDYYALDTDVSRGRRRFAEIAAAYQQAAASGAEWLLAPPLAQEAPERTMIRLIADFDPAPFWRANEAPTLALFGGKDWVVPAEANRAIFAKSISDNADFRAVTLQSANHLMFVADTGVTAEYASRSLIDKGYFSSISDWLGERR